MAKDHRRADKELVQQILLDDPEFLRRGSSGGRFRRSWKPRSPST
jgi:hypothetical protein